MRPEDNPQTKDDGLAHEATSPTTPEFRVDSALLPEGTPTTWSPPSRGPVSGHTSQRRRGPMLIGIVAGLLVLCCIGSIATAVVFGRIFSRDIPEASAAATGYFDALKAHDWAVAHSYLSSSLQNTTTKESLQNSWTQREQITSRVTGFSTDHTTIRKLTSGTSATITSTITYANGFTEMKVLQMVKEGSDWKIASLP